MIVLEPAMCPQGYRVLGGGYEIADSGETVVASGPTSDGNGWAVTVEFTQPHVYAGDPVEAVCGTLG